MNIDLIVLIVNKLTINFVIMNKLIVMMLLVISMVGCKSTLESLVIKAAKIELKNKEVIINTYPNSIIYHFDKSIHKFILKQNGKVIYVEMSKHNNFKKIDTLKTGFVYEEMIKDAKDLLSPDFKVK